jgi:predicted DNA-binding transcriptional regulator YafY
MSKRESLNRYVLIVNLLRRRPASFPDIIEMLKKESNFQGYNFTMSKRTFQRDCEDIAQLFNIEIAYDRPANRYYIKYDENSKANERIMEAFDTFNSLKLRERLSDFIFFENRRPAGTEYMQDLIKAIEGEITINIVYERFGQADSFEILVEPYALKEFKNRWYLVGKDSVREKIRTYGLDRIQSIEFSNTKFTHPKSFNLNEYFKYCFGIFIPPVIKPEKIVLSFTPQIGNYIRTMPLHESQEVITDSEQEFRISLYLCITPDFITEIRSYGRGVQVIKPKSLTTQIG